VSAKSDASPDAFPDAPVLPALQVHWVRLAALVHGPASAVPGQDAQGPDKSVCPESDSREDASARPAAAKAAARQTLDSADAAAINAPPDPDAAALPASAPAAPLKVDFHPVAARPRVPSDAALPAHCSAAAQSALPALGLPDEGQTAALLVRSRWEPNARQVHLAAAAAADLSIPAPDVEPPVLKELWGSAAPSAEPDVPDHVPPAVPEQPAFPVLPPHGVPHVALYGALYGMAYVALY
jgi:hypothetical protein